jgi:hypothetical protein
MSEDPHKGPEVHAHGPLPTNLLGRKHPKATMLACGNGAGQRECRSEEIACAWRRLVIALVRGLRYLYDAARHLRTRGR